MMKKLFLFLIPLFLFSACSLFEELEEDDIEIEVNESSITPSSTNGRPNVYLGCVEINSRVTRISAWDHGTIDGDVISLLANGDAVLSQYELDGPSNKVSLDYDFGFNGYNYLVLYAHNEGDISPNTAAVSINGTEFILESNLQSNGYVDIVVSGYGVECGADGGGTGGGGGTGTDDEYSVTFWVASDFGCGNITVNLTNYGSSTISSYYSSSGPGECSASGCANFNNLPAGNYSYTASCDGYTWDGSFTLSDSNCLLFQLTL